MCALCFFFWFLSFTCLCVFVLYYYAMISALLTTLPSIFPVGMVTKPSSEQSQDFSIHNEDFPALPGPNYQTKDPTSTNEDSKTVRSLLFLFPFSFCPYLCRFLLCLFLLSFSCLWFVLADLSAPIFLSVTNTFTLSIVVSFPCFHVLTRPIFPSFFVQSESELIRKAHL